MSAIDVMLQQPAAQAIGWALVQFVWQGAVIGLLTAIVLTALRRAAADVRYVVSTIALALMLTMPVVTAVQSFKGNMPSGRIRRRRRRPGASRRSSRPPVAPDDRVQPLERGATARVPSSEAGLEGWLPMLMTAWLAGVALLTLRLFTGWLWVQRLKTHGASAATASVEALASRLVRRLHITRTVRFLQSTLVDVPTVIGCIRPVVLLPASALSGLTPQQLEAILAHELAHIRRHDYLVNLLQTVVETLLFYHPAVWWVSRRIRVERENCCDDLAVSLCGDPVAYAAALAELETSRGRGQLVLAATGGSLLDRVRRLLGAPSHAGRAPGWLAAAVATLLIVGISAGVLSRDIVVADAAIPSPIASVTRGDDALLPPEAPLPPAPPEAPEPLSLLAQDAAEVRELQAIRRITGPMTRERVVRRCIEWISSGIPIQFKGHAHSLRGACTALADVRQTLAADGRRAARDISREAAGLAREAAGVAREIRGVAREVAAIVPAVMEAMESAREPLEMAAAAIAALPPRSAAEVQPVLSRIPKVVQTAQPTSAPRAAPRGQARARQNSGNHVWSHNGERFEISYRGDVEFTDDDTDVRSITPGGWFRIKDGKRFASDMTVEFKADGAGNIQRKFWIGWSERPFEPEGRAWLTSVLPRFIRQSGIGAAGRVARIHRARGTAGVFAEIGLIEGSFAKRVYFTELLKLPSIGARDVQQALAQAGREIDSDFELASLLIATDRLVQDEQTRKAYLDAARTIDSDFELRRVFSAALKDGPSPALIAGMLDTATTIESDFEAASLLADVAKSHPLDATIRGPFFRTLDTVDSSFEHRRVLTEVLRRADATPEALAIALQSVAQIESDFECATVLLQFVKAHGVEGVLRAPFFKAVETLSSAFERGRVLQAVARRSDASADTTLAVIRSATPMGSSFETSQVLLAVAGTQALTREARDAYIDASQKLGEFEQGQVLSALVKGERRTR